MTEPHDSALPGMLSIESLHKAVANGEIDTVLTVFPDIYGRLLGKRLTAQFFLDHIAKDSAGTHVCDYLLACDMEMDPVPGYAFASWTDGYGDMLAVPDLTTLRCIGWLPGTAMVVCDLFCEPTGTAADPAPRRILQCQLEQADSLGFRAMGGTELEFYAFNESYESARKKGYSGLETSADYIEDYHIFQTSKEEGLMRAIRLGLGSSGVLVEGTKGEWGPGQHELNLIYSDVLSQADSAVICKHGIREIADLQQKAITFMAKWDDKLAGSGMHLHLSLWDRERRKNLFVGDQRLGSALCSDTFRWFIGGLLAHTRELTGLFAPNVSSYKRFQSSSFAPTTIAWSDDNRTAGYRVVGAGSSLRIECRIPGADANPYLVYAAALAAGMDGVQNRIEPPAPFSGDIYAAADLPRLPGNLRDAISALDASQWARDAFGEGVVNHYLHFLKTEQRKFDEVITDWEKQRFFERI